MDRRDFYNGQPVTEGELDGAFAAVETAIWNLSADLPLLGIFSGLTPSQHAPVADLTIDLSAGTAYDHTGRRIRVATAQRPDLSVDENGVSTAVAGGANERWVSLFAAFDRALSDERIDEASQQVYFVRNESFKLVVRQGAEAGAGLGQKPGLAEGLILLCDVKLTNGKTQILTADLNTDRRQEFTIFGAGRIPLDPDAFADADLITGSGTVESALLELDTEAASLLSRLDAHTAGSAEKHAASHVTAPAVAWLETLTVGAQLAELVNGLADETAGAEGVGRIGFKARAGTASFEPEDGTLADFLDLVAAQIRALRTDVPRAIATVGGLSILDNGVSNVSVGATQPDFVTARIDTPKGTPIGVRAALSISPPWFDGDDSEWYVQVDNQSGIDLDYTLHAWARVP